MARTVRRKLFCLFLLLPVLLQAPLSGADAGGVLTLPAGLSVLPEEAFCGDTSLDAVVIPEGVTAIGARAFAESCAAALWRKFWKKRAASCPKAQKSCASSARS